MTHHRDQTAPTQAAPRHAAQADRAESIRVAIESAARFLPTQGPIGVFIAQNALQAFECEPFEEAVVHAARIYGTQPYLSEARYREELARGRIRAADLEAVLDSDTSGGGALLANGRLSLRDLQLALRKPRRPTARQRRRGNAADDVFPRFRGWAGRRGTAHVE